MIKHALGKNEQRNLLSFTVILSVLVVAVNSENDTYFENGPVMGYADCKYYAGLVETSKVVSIGPLSDTLQAGASLQFLPMGQYGLCFGYCFSGPLPLRSHKEQVTFLVPTYGLCFGYSVLGLLTQRSNKRQVTFYGAISGSP